VKGRKRQYPWGDEFDEGKCNTKESGMKDTMPVDWYSPRGDSPYGCAEMAGNVWEWTSSLPHLYWTEHYREEQVSSGHRVARGGSYTMGAWYARCAFRSGMHPTAENGFRCSVRATSSEELSVGTSHAATINGQQPDETRLWLDEKWRSDQRKWEALMNEDLSDRPFSVWLRP
jgi:hypothetical protein